MPQYCCDSSSSLRVWYASRRSMTDKISHSDDPICCIASQTSGMLGLMLTILEFSTQKSTTVLYSMLEFFLGMSMMGLLYEDIPHLI